MRPLCLRGRHRVGDRLAGYPAGDVLILGNLVEKKMPRKHVSFRN